MPFTIVRNDITKMEVDAIVNAARHSLLGGGGVDGAIHRAAGPGLREECARLGGCDTGEAKITFGYRLPAHHVIHTVGPVWQDGRHGERQLLASCYTSALRVAAENGCRSVAFPLISAGAYGYPVREALQVATETIASYLAAAEDEPEVYLVLYGADVMSAARARFPDVQEYVDDVYTAPDEAEAWRRKAYHLGNDMAPGAAAPSVGIGGRPSVHASAAKPAPAAEAMVSDAADILGALEDESFSEMLLRLIDERGMTDVQCYKKANVDRKLFSKIRSDRLYRPKKATAFAFAIALELDLRQTGELLAKAGYAISHSFKFDVIIEYFILHRHYDIFDINEALFAYDQPLLGA